MRLTTRCPRCCFVLDEQTRCFIAGFGDDSLQHYSNHQLLDDSHDALFLVDEAYMAVHGNGSCPQIMSDGPDGPPTGQTEHIPSNLEREAVSWRSIQHTLSPVWKELIEEEPKCAPETNVIEVAKGVTAEVCYNVTAAALSVAVTMDMAGVTEQVWMVPCGDTQCGIPLFEPCASSAAVRCTTAELRELCRCGWRCSSVTRTSA